MTLSSYTSILSQNLSNLYSWNLDKLLFLIKENQDTFQNIAIFYMFWFVLNMFTNSFVLHFKKNNRNLLPTVSSYHFLVHINNTMYNFHDAAIAILLCVGGIQYMKLGKMTNIYCYIFQLILKLVLSILQWKKDYNTHYINNETVTIYRNGKKMTIIKRKLITGDIIISTRYCIVPIKKGIVTDILFLQSIGINVSKNKLGVNNLSQTGEDISKQRNVNDYVFGGQVQVSSETSYITVMETYNSTIENVSMMNTQFQSLSQRATFFGIYIIMLMTIIITILKSSTTIDVVELFSDSISAFIANNFLIPSFKLNLGLEFWNMCYVILCAYYGFSLNTHGMNMYDTYTPEETIICTDKTGTLVKSMFGLLTDACQFFFDMNHSDVTKKSMIIGHIGAMYRDEKLGHLGDCVENGAIMNGMHDMFKIIVGKEYIYKDMISTISYMECGVEHTMTRYIAFDYEDKNHGSFSLIQQNGVFYITFEMGIGPANTYLGYKRVGTSDYRGMVIGYITTVATTYEEAYSLYTQILPTFQKKSHRKLPFTYTVCGEFYFDHKFCENGDMSTDKALMKLVNCNYPIMIISGDKPETLEAIGKSAGLQNGLVVNMNIFNECDMNKQVEIIRSAQISKVAYFGNASPEGKAHIISLYQYLGKKVIMAGDQKNDTNALMKADFGVLNSDGDKSMYPLANILSKVPMEAIYIYLTKMRLLGTMGNFWFFMSYNMYSYITAIIGFIGMYQLQFMKVSILFMDPWDANLSTVISSLMLFSCITISFVKTHKKLSENEIVYLAPIKGIIFSLGVGILLTFLPIDFYMFSLPSIFLVSIGLFVFW
jgi:soluble P-type ATPase